MPTVSARGVAGCRQQAARAVLIRLLQRLPTCGGGAVERGADVVDRDPGEDPRFAGRRAVVDPLADDAGRLEARVATLDAPAEDLLVERGGGVDVARRDLQVADLAVCEPGALLAHLRTILGAGRRCRGASPNQSSRAPRPASTVSGEKPRASSRREVFASSFPAATSAAARSCSGSSRASALPRRPLLHALALEVPADRLVAVASLRHRPARLREPPLVDVTETPDRLDRLLALRRGDPAPLEMPLRALQGAVAPGERAAAASRAAARRRARRSSRARSRSSASPTLRPAATTAAAGRVRHGSPSSSTPHAVTALRAKRRDEWPSAAYAAAVAPFAW